MKILILSVLAFALAVFAFTAMAQEKQASYWVTTDAGTQVEIFPNNTLLSQEGSRAAGSITTFYGYNNYGNPGGAYYFDITVGPSNININAFDINTSQPGNITLTVYNLVGTSVGNETNAGAWGVPVSVATGTGAGLNVPSNVTLNTPITLLANTTYGIAFVLDAGHAHYYTNGTGGNQYFSNADLSLSFGQATNVPFTPGVFTPRVWNGTIYYNTATVPLSNWAMGIGLLLILGAVVLQFRRS
jgi:hypothetical protein